MLLVTIVLFTAPALSHKIRGSLRKPPRHGWRKDDFEDVLRKHSELERGYKHHPMSKDLPSPIEKNLCETCITFAQQTIQQLLDIILSKLT